MEHLIEITPYKCESFFMNAYYETSFVSSFLHSDKEHLEQPAATIRFQVKMELDKQVRNFYSYA